MVGCLCFSPAIDWRPVQGVACLMPAIDKWPIDSLCDFNENNLFLYFLLSSPTSTNLFQCKKTLNKTLSFWLHLVTNVLSNIYSANVTFLCK